MGTWDDHLVQRAVAGDRDALGNLLEHFGNQVASQLRSHLGRRWRGVLDVDDVMQVTFLEAFLEIGRLTAGDVRSFVGWLHRIAENNLRDAVRGLECQKRFPKSGRLRPSSGCDSFAGLFELVGGMTSTPSRHAADREIKQLLEKATSQLPADYGTVLRLHDPEGHSVVEVARRMGRSRGAVHMLRARALAKLAESLGSQSKFFSDLA